MDATHFKLVKVQNEDDADTSDEHYTPCSPGDEHGTPMTLNDVPPEKLLVPKITKVR